MTAAREANAHGSRQGSGKICTCAAVIVFLLACSAYAESPLVPLAIYGGSNGLDLAATYYGESRGLHEGGPILIGFDGDKVAQGAFKVTLTLGEWYLDKQLAPKPKLRWGVRIFVFGVTVGFGAIPNYRRARRAR